jgi:type I restriction enzyme S subunit
LLARTDEFRAFAIQEMNGSSGRQRVSAESLSKYRLGLPQSDADLHKHFGLLVEPHFQAIGSLARQSRNLSEIRETILPRMISGELRFRDDRRTHA